MQKDTFRALIIESDGENSAAFRDVPIAQLPPGDVLIKVAYSSLNYKDGLAITGRGKVVRRFPMAPGIDLAGVVIESQSAPFSPGDRVVATGGGLGEDRWGGYAELARVPDDLLVPLPTDLSLQQAMSVGTAGVTAMLGVMILEEHGVLPESGPVVVTGAAGGVGGVAIAILSHLGYSVTASTGRAEEHAYLRGLGAVEIVSRDVFAAKSAKPLESARWAGAIDSVGGDTLASLLRTMKYGGCVAACGMTGGGSLDTTVMPFILRGISLVGIASAACPLERKRAAWRRIAADLPLDVLSSMTTVVPLDRVKEMSEEILAGRVRGRTVVEVDGAGE